MESRDCSLLKPYLSLLIILPDNEAGSPEVIKKIIAEVNSTQVDPEEVLSGNLYYYDSAKKKIVIA